MKKICILSFAIISFSFFCCKSNLDFEPIHIDAPVISIKALNTEEAVISFSPVDKANYYKCYSSSDNNYFSAGSFLDSSNTSITVPCQDYSKTYYYKIIAYDDIPSESNNWNVSESDFSNVVSICLAEENIEVTKIVSVDYKNESSVKLQWLPLKNASSYYVYCGTENNIETMQLVSIEDEAEGIVDNLEKDTEYYFCVRSIINEEEKETSNIENYNLSKYLAPVDNITGTVVLQNNNGTKSVKVSLTWDKVEGASKYYITSTNLKSSEFFTTGWRVYTNSFNEEIPESQIKEKLPDDPDKKEWKTIFSIQPEGNDKYVTKATKSDEIKLTNKSTSSTTNDKSSNSAANLKASIKDESDDEEQISNKKSNNDNDTTKKTNTTKNNSNTNSSASTLTYNSYIESYEYWLKKYEKYQEKAAAAKIKAERCRMKKDISGLRLYLRDYTINMQLAKESLTLANKYKDLALALAKKLK